MWLARNARSFAALSFDCGRFACFAQDDRTFN
jgi:hypothetical protein